MAPKNIVAVIFSLAIVLILQGCAGSGNIAGNGDSKEYDQGYERMKEVVSQAIKASNMNINFVNESADDGKLTLAVSRDSYMGNEQVQKEQGEVRIIKKGDKTTIVEVDNPDYHFSVPSHKKENYQRIIYLRIDNILEK